MDPSGRPLTGGHDNNVTQNNGGMHHNNNPPNMMQQQQQSQQQQALFLQHQMAAQQQQQMALQQRQQHQSSTPKQTTPPSPHANFLPPVAAINNHSQASAASRQPHAATNNSAVVDSSSAASPATQASQTPTQQSAQADSNVSIGKKAAHRSNGASSSHHAAAAVATPPLTLEQAQPLLAQCNWVDKTIWVSRQFMGGQANNGFLRATATMQRMKKQRQRQVTKSNHGDAKKRELDASQGTFPDAVTSPPLSNQTDQEAEETLKLEVMNARTAKKFKIDMEAGIEYCQFLHETIRQLMVEMDPDLTPPESLTSAGVPSAWLQMRERQKQGIATPVPNGQAPTTAPVQMLNGSAHVAMAQASQQTPAPAQVPHIPTSSSSLSRPTVKNHKAPSPSSTAAASSGLASESTLRKNRKKKLAPSDEPVVPISEFDTFGKRLCSKKEHSFRIAEFLRFRALRQGDLVAARLSSRDLWILARVVHDYPTHTLSPSEFFQITEAKRSQHFRDKVILQDVEDTATNQAVARDLVLPLPRSYSEAAEWCSRLKKGYRAYCMYPQTTSLYSATVVDSTMYARGDDDVVVVEFDGDEPDPITGAIPKCHVPARFVTLIPRDFAAANVTPNQSAAVANTSTAPKSNKKTSLPRTTGVDDIAEAANMALSGDAMNFDFDDDALPGLDFADLDFTM
ncbi:hypothetical protein MPSEU_000949400 [Mayamaea pseudoterrestris]|nr:hypothetical protein MPSEU_000949400 [Mayamaea pseudoterrestris]